MKSFNALLRDFCHIPLLDLADAAETNRYRNSIWSFYCVALLIVLFPANFFVFRNDFAAGLVHFGYFGISFVVSLISLIISITLKNARREKAWLIKNIPVYFVYTWGMASSAYVFYLTDHPFNGVLNFFTATVIMLTVFQLALTAFSAMTLCGMLALLPGVYKAFGFSCAVFFVFLSLFLVFLSFYKRRIEKLYFSLLMSQKKLLEARTFGNFTLLYESKVVKFSRTKSTELIAYLVYKNGSSANTKELISVLYGDFADSERYGSSLRSLVSDVKHSLANLGIQNFFIAEYNNFRVNPETVRCDYYDFLSDDAAAIKRFAGEFMSQYSWAEAGAAFLEQKALKLNA